VDGGTDDGSDAGLSANEEAARSRRYAARNLADATKLTEEAARLTEQAADARRKAGYLEHRGQSFETGAEGEIATGRILDALKSKGWIVLHDLRWPGRPRANIDHIAVGPGGIVVIDTKNWSGRVDVRDGKLRQNGQRREREVASAADAAVAVVALLPTDLHASVRPVICLTREEFVEVTARGVQITSTASLATYLRGLGPVLSVAEIDRAAQALELSLRPRSSRAAPGVVERPSAPVKPMSQRSSRRRPMPQSTRKTSSQRAGGSKRKKQSVIPLVLVLGVLLLIFFFPTAYTTAIEWFSTTVGGFIGDAVIPEPSPKPSGSPVSSP
jgi:hypothetical protein